MLKILSQIYLQVNATCGLPNGPKSIYLYVLTNIGNLYSFLAFEKQERLKKYSCYRYKEESLKEEEFHPAAASRS